MLGNNRIVREFGFDKMTNFCIFCQKIEKKSCDKPRKTCHTKKSKNLQIVGSFGIGKSQTSIPKIATCGRNYKGK